MKKQKARAKKKLLQRNRGHKEKTKILEVKNMITEIESSMDGLNSRTEGTKERISELEKKTKEIIQSQQQREYGLKTKEKEQSFSIFRTIIKKYNILAIRVLERKKKEGKLKKTLEEVSTEKFTSLARDINQQIQEAEKTPDRIMPKKSIPRYIIIKSLKTKKNKDNILKVAREKPYLSYRGKTI